MVSVFKKVENPSQPAERIQLPDEIQKIIAQRPESQSIINELYKNEGYTVPHSLDVAQCNLKIAEQLGLDEEEKARLVLSGLFHDLGKNHVSPEIIEKPRELSAAEREEIDQHARISFDILKEIMPDVAAIVVAHHEFQDKIPAGHRNGNNGKNLENGRTLPAQENGNGIIRKDDPRTKELAEILALVDQFHSLIDPNRPYRKPISIDAATKEKLSDPHFSEKAKKLLEVIAEHYR